MNAMSPTAAGRTRFTFSGPWIAGSVLAAGLAVLLAFHLLDPPGLQADRAEALLKGPVPAARDVRSIAIAGLKDNPLDARLLRTLGQVAEKSGDPNRAQRLFNAAGKLTRRDVPTELALMKHAVQTTDFNSAFMHADALLRREPELVERLAPLMMAMASDSRGLEPLAKRLDPYPTWRYFFLAKVSNEASPATMFAILDRLNRGPNKPTDEEIGWYLDRLSREGRYEEAQLGWLLFLSATRLAAFEGVYNGGFSDIGGPKPFTWNLMGGPGGQIDVATPSDRPQNRALRVVYDGFSTPRLANQLVVLAPGRYDLRVEGKHSSPLVIDQLAWTLSCVRDHRVLVRTNGGGVNGWQLFSATFEVPPDCPAQVLELVAAPGDRRTSMEGWFDNVTIVPSSTGGSA